MIVRHTYTVTPLGELCLVASDDEISGIYFPSHTPPPPPQRLGVCVSPADSTLSAAADQLHQYFSGSARQFNLALYLPQNGFQREVWDYLTMVEYGQTVSYGQIAAGLGRPRAARAVGTALANNPISIVIPCHRVVSAAGNLTGYAGGEAAKRYLLTLERHHARNSDLFSGLGG